ncbi:D-alanyl-D-alanine dipeptidase [Pseudarcicella hirudinis]|uniref:D-alanyl-D-alanine dipeptidase n=2 Tax=Pseudarcicella hirudinis TaxID=1079859 RepID=A0A1I5QV67_9BACT|nr:M15 family metallopeptidase [Pseudarcicella hirudinis]SFP50145.1 D-alanyl-D-alanine dipeptidase [Pseudarcicella hirudinis]
MKKVIFINAILLSFSFGIFSQQSPSKNKKTPTPCPYEVQMQKQGLVDVQTIDKSLLVELKYSTTDNFVGKDVYGCITKCFMQKEPAEMLAKANRILKEKKPGYCLLIYDGGRPNAIQKVLWNTLSQYLPKEREKYVADPVQGSIHNFGSAVDLTVADAKGKALDMGTKFDFFGELAYPVKEEYFLKTGRLTKLQIRNRKLLREVMKQAGFMPIDYEWWHFNALAREKAKQRYKIIN